MSVEIRTGLPGYRGWRQPVAGPTIRSMDKNQRASIVVIAEDDLAIRLAISRMVERTGRAVAACPDADSALAELERLGDAAGLLITDVSMPGELDGIALAAHAARLSPDMPVVVMSGDAGSLARAERAGGVAATLAKPFDLSLLVSVLRSLMPSPPEVAGLPAVGAGLLVPEQGFEP
jgi:DNA-binding NtrC family response regulator